MLACLAAGAGVALEIRGAAALAQVLGYGESADAHHLTQPSAAGAARASGERARRTLRGRREGAVLDRSRFGDVATALRRDHGWR